MILLSSPPLVLLLLVSWVELVVCFHEVGENPYNQGNYEVDFLGLTLPDETWLDIYHPSSSGNFTICVFLTGADGAIPTKFYNDFLQNVASQGIIVAGIQFFPPKLPLDSLWKNYVSTLDWIESKLNEKLPNGIKAKTKNMVGMCHSAGCKILVKALDETCSLIGSAVLIDPVDGEDPWGFIPDYVITPGKKVNFTIPALILGSGYGPVHRYPWFPPCAPKGRNFVRFYNAWNDNVWCLNASDFGHADILDPWMSETSEYIQLCATKGGYLEYYWTFVAGSISSFVMGIMERQCEMLNNLTNRASIPIRNVDIQTDIRDECPKPQCFHNSPNH